MTWLAHEYVKQMLRNFSFLDAPSLKMSVREEALPVPPVKDASVLRMVRASERTKLLYPRKATSVRT